MRTRPVLVYLDCSLGRQKRRIAHHSKLRAGREINLLLLFLFLIVIVL